MKKITFGHVSNTGAEDGKVLVFETYTEKELRELERKIPDKESLTKIFEDEEGKNLILVKGLKDGESGEYFLVDYYNEEKEVYLLLKDKSTEKRYSLFLDEDVVERIYIDMKIKNLIDYVLSKKDNKLILELAISFKAAYETLAERIIEEVAIDVLNVIFEPHYKDKGSN